MVTVQKATIDLFERIYPLIEFFDMEDMNRDDWFQLLSKRWFPEHDHFGYVLLDDERVVGFLGVFFYQRTINGTLHDLCSFFCWHVLEEYRRQSLLLLKPVLNRKNLTITSLTPSPGATLIWDRFKFRQLEDQVIIFPLLPSFSPHSALECITDPDRIQSLLTGEDKKIFADHVFPVCRHLLIVDKEHKDGASCYLLYNRVQKKGMHFSQVCYFSNYSLFARAFPRLQWIFFKQHRTIFTLIDKRLLGEGKPGPGFSYTLRYPRRYRSDDLQPEQVDNLYAELLLLQRV